MIIINKNIDRLPKELIYIIFNQLNELEKFLFKFVNKHFYLLFENFIPKSIIYNQTFHLITYIIKKFHYKLNEKDFINIILENKNEIKEMQSLRYLGILNKY